MKKFWHLTSNRGGVVVLLILLSANWSCKQEFAELQSQKRSYALRISFEQELHSATTMPGVAFEDMPALLQASPPKNERQHIDILIFEDGSSETTIIEKRPQYPIEIQHECLPDISLKVAKTFISNNVIFTFDAKGRLIDSRPTESISYMPLLDAIRRNGNQLNRSIITSVFQQNHLKSGGGTQVEQLESGLTRVKQTYTANDNVHESMIGKTGESYFDTETGILLAVALIGLDNRYEFRKIIRYPKDNNNFLPEFERAESYLTDSQGNPYIVTHTTVYHNVVIENNL